MIDGNRKSDLEPQSHSFPDSSSLPPPHLPRKQNNPQTHTRLENKTKKGWIRLRVCERVPRGISPSLRIRRGACQPSILPAPAVPERKLAPRTKNTRGKSGGFSTLLSCIIHVIRCVFRCTHLYTFVLARARLSTAHHLGRKRKLTPHPPPISLLAPPPTR